MVTPQNLKTVLNKSISVKTVVPANILNHAFRSKSLYVCGKVFYDFKTMFAKLDEAELKLEELRWRKDHSGFGLFVYYSENVLTKENEYFCQRGEDCMDVFVEKIETILYSFASFSKQKMVFTEEDQTKYWSEKNLPYAWRGIYWKWKKILLSHSVAHNASADDNH